MKVKVLVDVANFTPRCWLTTDSIDIPLSEANRIAYFIVDGKLPNTKRINVYPYLAPAQKRKIDRICEPINISGIRGTTYVVISKRGLLQAIKDANL